MGILVADCRHPGKQRFEQWLEQQLRWERRRPRQVGHPRRHRQWRQQVLILGVIGGKLYLGGIGGNLILDSGGKLSLGGIDGGGDK